MNTLSQNVIRYELLPLLSNTETAKLALFSTKCNLTVDSNRLRINGNMEEHFPFIIRIKLKISAEKMAEINDIIINGKSELPGGI